MTLEGSKSEDVIKRPHLKEGDPGYDEYRESQSTADLTKEALNQMFRNAEILAENTEDSFAELSAELEASILEDPYLGWVLEKYRIMEPSKAGLLRKAAAKRPFNEDEIIAFTEALVNLDFSSVTEDMIFDLSYLKLISAKMTSDQRVHLLAKIPEGYQARAVAMMEKTHMVTSDEVQRYAVLKARQDGSTDVLGDARRYKDKVAEFTDEISAVIDQIPNNQKNYKAVPFKDRPKNESERTYTLKNAGLAGLFGVGIMTLAINTGGAMKLLLTGKPQEAFEHVANHPWASVGAAVAAGTAGLLRKKDRPISEAIMPGSGYGNKLDKLIEQKVSREAISHLKNEKFFYAIQNDFESSSDPEALRGLSLKDAFPEVHKNLKSRGLLPKPHQEASMVNDFVNLCLSLREWNYWSYGSCYNFAAYSDKKYSKTVLAGALRRKDEAEEKEAREGTSAEKPEATSTT